jgi:RNA polymerase sigma factor (sigma-70 family)
MESDPALREYLGKLGRYPLLRPEQEIELSRKVAAMMELLERQNAGDELTPDEKRTVKRGARAKQRFVEANLRLVVGVAKKYRARRRTLELLDLIQEGNIGLSRAVEKFDPGRGYKFSTYAYWWIRQAIQRAIQWDDFVVRLPLTIHNQLIKISRAQEALAQELGRDPSSAEVAQRLGVDLQVLTEAIRRTRFVGSLDEPLPGTDGDSTYADMLPDPDGLTAEQHLDLLNDQEEAQQLGQILSEQIDQRSRDVLASRHGDATEPWSEIERRTGLSRAVLQRIETQALNRCRRLMRRLPVAAAAAVAAPSAVRVEQVSLFDL